jgi:uncharacterized protein (DUF1501 family)
MNSPMNPLSRRQFLGRAACAAMGTTGLMSAMGTLRLFNATLAAQSVPNDGHKALVCLFLFGGNDSNNMLVPYDQPGYDTYLGARGEIALTRESLLPLTQAAGGDGREFAVHPSMGLLQSVFNEGKAAFLANVGTLVAPITRAEYRNGGASVPPYLFSHNDQQVQWQTSVPDSSKKIGWGGRIADLLHELNAANSISMNISIAGSNFFQVGNQTLQYPMSTGGSVGLSSYTSQNAPTKQQYLGLNETLGMSYSHLFEAEYASIMNSAIAKDLTVKDTLAATPRFDRAATAAAPNDQNLFPNARNANGTLTGVASQLHMILRLIYAQAPLGMMRQIFFASLGGWDTHDNQLTDQASLLKTLSDAVHDFYRATAALGLSDRVTLFTSSDFNRTYSSNAKGSDHAWGGHHFVVGGDVVGARVYGRMPILQSGGPDDTGSRGSWIPTTSTDEYAATLAKWFGVTPANMPLALPNIGRFANPDMGFMA